MTEPFHGWAILEVMGHRTLPGLVQEVQIAGATMLRVDVPAEEGDQPAVTQIYGNAAIFSITPCTEEQARRAAAVYRPSPLALEAPRNWDDDYDEDEDLVDGVPV